MTTTPADDDCLQAATERVTEALPGALMLWEQNGRPDPNTFVAVFIDHTEDDYVAVALVAQQDAESFIKDFREALVALSPEGADGVAACAERIFAESTTQGCIRALYCAPHTGTYGAMYLAREGIGEA